MTPDWARSVRDRLRARTGRLLGRIRRARYPWTGWRKWAVIVGEGTVGFVILFAVANLTLSLSTFRGEDPLRRTAHELGVLWFSTPDGKPTSGDAFEAVHGRDLGDDPSPAEIKAHFLAAAQGGTFLLDQVMVDRMEAVNGRVDADVLPPGVYVGAHALGPDKPPLVWVTKWLAHYVVFPRHAYILVVPEEGPAWAFSASQNGKFPGDTDSPDRLSARLTPYTDAAYDFPSSGEALHEMTIVSDDAAVLAGALERLKLARDHLEALDQSYGLLAPNSNTVVGCILEEAGLMTRETRRSALLALRAPGMGAACPGADETP